MHEEQVDGPPSLTPRTGHTRAQRADEVLGELTYRGDRHLEIGLLGLMGTPRGMAISSSAKNPNAAKLFMDFWLTKQAMTKLSNEVGEYVLTPGVFPPIDGMNIAKVIPIRTLSEKEISSYGAMFKKIFE